MRALIERLELQVDESNDAAGDDDFSTPSDKFIGFIVGTSKPGHPDNTERFKKTATEYGVKIIKIVGEQIHVKLPNGKYGFFTPSGPRSDRQYMWTPSAASNYKKDSDFVRGSW